MKNFFRGLITTDELVEILKGLDGDKAIRARRIQQLAPDLAGIGLAKKFNRTYVFHLSAAQHPMLRKK